MKRHFKQMMILLFGIFAMTNPLQGKQRDTLSSKSMEFIRNEGQWQANVLFKTPIHGGAIFTEKDGLMFTLLHPKQLEEFYARKRNPLPEKKYSELIDGAAYKMRFVQSNPSVKISGNDPKSHYYNYYIGNDPQHWASKVKIFERVVYEDIYDGIDLYLEENSGYFKYEFHVSAGKSVNAIILEYDGVKSLSLLQQNLIITTAVCQVMELKPFAYQINSKGDTVKISCEYKIFKNNRVGFEIGKYDKSRALIIDPVLIFSSYSGSSTDNWGYTATYDSQGNLYGGGIVFSTGYPITTGAYQTNYGGGNSDIAISKFSATGNTLFYSTYLGGSASDIPNSMIVNEYDDLYLLGTTGSSNFPITTGAYSNTFQGGTPYTLTRVINFTAGSDMVICRFNEDGESLLASTFLGGTRNDGLNTSPALKHNYADEVRGEITIDMNGNVCIVSSTFSSDFPVTEDSFQPVIGGGQDACIAKLNYNLSDLIWASYLGGEGQDAGYSISIASDNSIFLCGGTTSTYFPVTQNVVQENFSDVIGSQIPDGYVTRINEFGTSLLTSTYLGTSPYDQAYLIETDAADYPYIFGQTSAEGREFIKNALWHTEGGGQFLTKMTPQLNDIVWSTAYGTGKGPDISPSALMVDKCNNIYMSGWGSYGTNGFGGTSGLPVTVDAFQSTTDNNDYYFICINADASSLIYATFFGSPNSNEHVDGGTSRFDKKGKIYQAVCAGCGGYDDFPTTTGVWSATNNSLNCNLGVIKMDFLLPMIVADFSIPNVICITSELQVINNSQVIGNDFTYEWDFGDGNTSHEENPTHTYSEPGSYIIRLTVQENYTCNLRDDMYKRIIVLGNTVDTLAPVYLCNGERKQIGVAPMSGDVTYQWEPPHGLNDPTISNPIVSIDTSITYALYIGNGECNDTLIQQVNVAFADVEVPNDTIICANEVVMLNAINLHPEEEMLYYWSDDRLFTNILNPDPSSPIWFVAPNTTTTYYLKVVSDSCQLFYSITVYVSKILIDPISDMVVCFEEPVSINVVAQGVHCDHLFYAWEGNPSSILSDTDQSHLRVYPTGNQEIYIITVTNEHGCSRQDTVAVTLAENTFKEGFNAWTDTPVITEIIDTATLYSTLYDLNTYTYQWSPDIGLSDPNTPTTLASPLQTTLYTVVISDQYGCIKSDTVLIVVEPIICKEPNIFVPNAFTPNGDHLNDILYVRSEVIERMLFRIYNRWGDLVFETEDIQQGWDGTYKGQEAPAAVYDYYLEITCYNKTYYITKGNIQLLR